MAFQFPKLLGEINDKDTQFTAAVKKHQELVLLGAVILILAIAYFAYSAFSTGKRTGTWRYGLCKVFLEQYVYYPNSLEILFAEEGRTAARIGYLVTNAYGAQASEEMECFYTNTPQGIQVNRITINRKSLSLLQTVSEPPSSAAINGPVEAPSYQQIYALFDQSNDGVFEADVAQIHIDEFNKSISVIMASDQLDLSMPSKLADNIEDLKYD